MVTMDTVPAQILKVGQDIKFEVKVNTRVIHPSCFLQALIQHKLLWGKKKKQKNGNISLTQFPVYKSMELRTILYGGLHKQNQCNQKLKFSLMLSI